MRGFLMRLVRASGWGASLVLVAGCAPEVVVNGGTGGESPSGGSGGGGAGAGGLVDENGNELLATPLATCYGPIYDDGFGYHGQCCDYVLCAPAQNGVCASAGTVQLNGLPPGSGECMCEEPRGPYLDNDPSSIDSCCYLVGSISCDGRPLSIDGAPRLADVVSGRGAWCPGGAEPCPAIDTLDPELRAAISRRWADRARFEHASIASFARFSMMLLACGAPPSLICAAQTAAMDEVRHAQVALALAAEYAGRPLDFAPLDISGALSEAASLEAVAIATVIEGCVGETLAAIEVAACAAAAGPSEVREALAAIAEDETRHAELAWAFVRWAVGKGGPSLRGRVSHAFAQAFERVRAEAESRDPWGSPEHGFLSGREVSELHRQAIAEVLRPAAAALLADQVEGPAVTVRGSESRSAPCFVQ